MSIPVFRTYIRRKDMDTVLNCLVTDSVGPGEYLDRFQKSARESFGFDFGFALRSPLAALGLALDSLALSEGDAVALPALAPAYYAEVLQARGMRPVFVDAAPDSTEPDLGLVDGLEPRPKALVLHEGLGHPAGSRSGRGHRRGGHRGHVAGHRRLSRRIARGLPGTSGLLRARARFDRHGRRRRFPLRLRQARRAGAPQRGGFDRSREQDDGLQCRSRTSRSFATWRAPSRVGVSSLASSRNRSPGPAIV